MILEFVFFFFFNDTATTEIYTLSLHDALPISPLVPWRPSYAYIGMCVNDWPAASRGTASRAGLCDQRPAATVRQVEDRRKVCRPCCAGRPMATAAAQAEGLPICKWHAVSAAGERQPRSARQESMAALCAAEEGAAPLAARFVCTDWAVPPAVTRPTSAC